MNTNNNEAYLKIVAAHCAMLLERPHLNRQKSFWLEKLLREFSAATGIERESAEPAVMEYRRSGAVPESAKRAQWDWSPGRGVSPVGMEVAK